MEEHLTKQPVLHSFFSFFLGLLRQVFYKINDHIDQWSVITPLQKDCLLAAATVTVTSIMLSCGHQVVLSFEIHI